MSTLNYVLLDCDVFRHFHRGCRLEILPKLFPDSLVFLDIVKNELTRSSSLRQPVSQFISSYNIQELKFPTEIKYTTEYGSLISKMKDDGESACMAYAKFNPEYALASSNLKDIQAYCNSNQIPYVTTLDILIMANKAKIISVDECNTVISLVKASRSKLPVDTIQEYIKGYPTREIKIIKPKPKK